MPDTHADLAFATAHRLAGLIRRRKISSVELTTLYLDRLRRHGEALGAVVTLTPKLALEQAREADRDLAQGAVRSGLHGVPYGVKDLFATRGIPTTWGSRIYRDRVIDEDASVVRSLRDAGCPLLAKLATVEFAGSVGYRTGKASLTGAARTPWDSSRWSGGSSSGSGAAVAAGLVGFAIGTETWGSILCPSAFCGITGLRPTYGRVSRAGAMALSPTMDKVGPMARGARDTALILQIVAGAGAGRDAGLRPANEARFRAPAQGASVAGLRLGIVRPDYGDETRRQPETEAAFEAALRALASVGIELQEAALLDLPTNEAAGAIIRAEAALLLADVIADPDKLALVVDDKMRENLAKAPETRAVDYLAALRTRDQAVSAAPAVFSGIDALISPSYLQVSPGAEEDMDAYFTGSDRGLGSWGNLAGLPAIGLPMGFGARGLPLGVQLVGPPLSERTLLALAEAYQAAMDWHKRRPPGL